jgi:hypothetical protein
MVRMLVLSSIGLIKSRAEHTLELLDFVPQHLQAV